MFSTVPPFSVENHWSLVFVLFSFTPSGSLWELRGVPDPMPDDLVLLGSPSGCCGELCSASAVRAHELVALDSGVPHALPPTSGRGEVPKPPTAPGIFSDSGVQRALPPASDLGPVALPPGIFSDSGVQHAIPPASDMATPCLLPGIALDCARIFSHQHTSAALVNWHTLD